MAGKLLTRENGGHRPKPLLFPAIIIPSKVFYWGIGASIYWGGWVDMGTGHYGGGRYGGGRYGGGRYGGGRYGGNLPKGGHYGGSILPYNQYIFIFT